MTRDSETSMKCTVSAVKNTLNCGPNIHVRSDDLVQQGCRDGRAAGSVT